jgi:hypothetical protein
MFIHNRLCLAYEFFLNPLSIDLGKSCVLCQSKGRPVRAMSLESINAWFLQRLVECILHLLKDARVTLIIIRDFAGGALKR